MHATNLYSSDNIQNKTASKAYNRFAFNKIAEVVSNLHLQLLQVRSMEDNYRDLSVEEEELLEATKNDTEINSLFAGILAIDSCVYGLMESERRIQQELMVSLFNVANEFKIVHHFAGNLEVEDKKLGTSVNNLGASLLDLFDTFNGLAFVNKQFLGSIKNQLEMQQFHLLNKHRSMAASLQIENGNLKKTIKHLEEYCEKLKHENFILKKYQDVDTVLLLEQLETEIDYLKMKNKNDKRGYETQRNPEVDLKKKLRRYAEYQLNVENRNRVNQNEIGNRFGYKKRGVENRHFERIVTERYSPYSRPYKEQNDRNHSAHRRRGLFLS